MAATHSDSFVTALETGKQMLRETSTDKWSEWSHHNGILVETKAYPFCPINAVRGTVKLGPYSPENLKQIAKLCWELTYDQLHSTDSSLRVYKILEQMDEDQRVAEMVHKLPFPLHDRQTIYQERRIRENGDTYFISINRESHPAAPASKQYVRTQVHTSLWAIVADGNQISVSRMVHIDPNGLIPNFVVNLNLGKIESVLDFVRKHWKREPGY